MKSKDGWEFDGGTLKNSNGKSIIKAHNKETLKEIAQFLGINRDDVKMVSETNAKHLVALGSKSLKELIESKFVTKNKLGDTLNFYKK